jgi:hypothetical protein
MQFLPQFIEAGISSAHQPLATIRFLRRITKPDRGPETLLAVLPEGEEHTLVSGLLMSAQAHEEEDGLPEDGGRAAHLAKIAPAKESTA